MNYYEIGQRIRKIRKAHGLSQEALAEAVGISVTHMSHIETGNTKLSLPVFVALAAALEVRTDELLQDRLAPARGEAINEILCLLESCSTRQLRIMEEILRSIKITLEKYA